MTTKERILTLARAVPMSGSFNFHAEVDKQLACALLGLARDGTLAEFRALAETALQAEAILQERAAETEAPAAKTVLHLPGRGTCPLPPVPTKVETLHLPGRSMPIFAAAEKDALDAEREREEIADRRAAAEEHDLYRATRFEPEDVGGQREYVANERAEANYLKEAV